MNNQDEIDEYDQVEIIEIPDEYSGVIDIGDIGIVVEKYNKENFEVECGRADGSYKWLEPLNIRYIRLKSKNPYDIQKD